MSERVNEGKEGQLRGRERERGGKEEMNLLRRK